MIKARIIAIAAVAALGTGGVAYAATSPAVSAQHTATSGKAPVTVPGSGVKKGAKLPAGARIVYRDVTLSKGQKVKLSLKAPAGKTIRGLAVRDDDKVGFALVGPASYVGKQNVTVRAYTAPKADGSETGRIYALVR